MVRNLVGDVEKCIFMFEMKHSFPAVGREKVAADEAHGYLTNLQKEEEKRFTIESQADKMQVEMKEMRLQMKALLALAENTEKELRELVTRETERATKVEQELVSVMSAQAANLRDTNAFLSDGDTLALYRIRVRHLLNVVQAPSEKCTSPNRARRN
ncbi:hypothetical protein CPB84DRAFT_1493086 [Gymnopilus junonius]|uniref:Uncharacterized protein n=1 Tax=Gymnopilus junonius TaxID=109634 RepID=A0A9P5NH78_GYMJU|nr:hypothetical protein CPB84DRAFT_1493086 [Gymnopilus junonius]